MQDIERLAAENARLKAALSRSGFKITYTSTGEIKRISRPQKPKVQHTAVTWSKKLADGISKSGQRVITGKASLAYIRRITKDRKMTLRKYKNLVERAEMVREAQEFLQSSGFDVPNRFFDRVPTYVLKNNDFYENVNAVLNSTAESDGSELDAETIRYSMEVSVDRIKRVNKKTRKVGRRR